MMLKDTQIGKLDYIKNHNHNYLTQLLADSANSLLFFDENGSVFLNLSFHYSNEGMCSVLPS